MTGRVLSLPAGGETKTNFNEKSIVEFYSR
jgi:hypothetical protein